SGALPAALADGLSTDRTPDVPIRTSDVYLEQLLDAAAKAEGKERDALVDGLLREAWHDKAAWEPDIRLLDRIGHAFGVFSPRSLAELEDQTRTLPDLSDGVKKHGEAWKGAVGDLDEANLDRFLAAHEEWKSRLEKSSLDKLDEPARRALTAELLAALVPFTHGDRATDRRLRILRKRAEAAGSTTYRMEVRLAAALRLRAVLTSIAGRVHLATRGTAAERAAYEAIRACENLSFAPEPPAITSVAD